MRATLPALTLLAITACSCKSDECELGESPCEGPTTYLECVKSSSHVPDFNPSFNRFVAHSCGDLYSRCVPQGDDGHACVLGFEAEACEVLPIGALDDPGLRKVLAGDVSGDGHADLLLVSQASLSLRRHTPDGTFAALERLPEQTRPVLSPYEQRAWLVDLDGDGELDVLREVSGSWSDRAGYGHRVDVLFARAEGFEARDLGVDLEIGYVGDLEDDGLAEVVAISGGDAIIVRFEDGAFELTPIAIEPASGVSIHSLIAIDLYGTGAKLLIARSQDDTHVLERVGDDYQRIDAPRLERLDPTVAAFADFDGDGATDTAELSEFEPALRVRLSNGDGSVRDQRLPLPHRPPRLNGDALGDVDGDGSPDLVLDHGHGIISVVLNDGEGRFLAPRTFQLDHAPNALTVAPLDSTNPQADLITVQGDFVGFVSAACL